MKLLEITKKQLGPIKVPITKPRDPNHELLRSKQSKAGGPMRDKKAEQKRGLSKYSQDVSEGNWNDSAASDANGRWSKYSKGEIGVQTMATWLYGSRIHKKTRSEKLKSAYGAIAQQENTSKLISSTQADNLRAALKKKYGVNEEVLEEKVNPDYVKGLSAAERSEMKHEISRFKKMDSKDPAAYPDDWTADQKYKERLKKSGKKIPQSKNTTKYREMYGEEELSESALDTALKNKAEKTGFSLSILRQVWNRGAAAWRTGHRPGVSQAQWAMGRVNSFLVGGAARTSDKDLWDKRK